MGISVEEAIHELRNREEVFVAYSQATRLPYVTCDEETFNDQARIFATEEMNFAGQSFQRHPSAVRKGGF